MIHGDDDNDRQDGDGSDMDDSVDNYDNGW